MHVGSRTIFDRIMSKYLTALVSGDGTTRVRIVVVGCARLSESRGPTRFVRMRASLLCLPPGGSRPYAYRWTFFFNCASNAAHVSICTRYYCYHVVSLRRSCVRRRRFVPGRGEACVRVHWSFQRRINKGCAARTLENRLSRVCKAHDTTIRSVSSHGNAAAAAAVVYRPSGSKRVAGVLKTR